MLHRVAVHAAVVFVEGVGAYKAGVAASDQPALMLELELRLDAHFAHDMENAEKRVVRRLGAPVCRDESLAHPANTSPPACHRPPQSSSCRVPEVECRVNQDVDVEQTQMAGGAGEQGVLGPRRRDTPQPG